MADSRAKAERSKSLTIKNPTTYQLIRRLAERTGESMTQSVTVAVQERLDRLEAQSAEQEQRRRELQELADSLAVRFTEPFKSLDHGEWLYDEHGLPR